MSYIFTIGNINDFSEKLNIDDLYEKKRNYDISKLAVFNKILNRVHVRIKTTSKQRLNDHFCWFIVPEIIIGVPNYEQAACIAYIMDKLKENGFNIKYVHPNALLIGWQHWVPSYVRAELKNKTGIVVDEYGNKVENMPVVEMPTITKETKQVNTKFTPINKYKPTGNLVYNDELINKIGNKLY